MPVITILTDPIPMGRYRFLEFAKRSLRWIKYKLKPLPRYLNLSYRGHYSVTRSLVEGLNKIEIDASYNPTSLNDLADTVIVLSGVTALKQAIALKRKGRIRKLLAGPNILVFPSEHNAVITQPEVDICIVPSEWTRAMYLKDCPALTGRCVAWAAGVDVSYWKPAYEEEKQPIVLIFEKLYRNTVGSIEQYADVLKRHGYETAIIKYGEYTRQEYLSALQRAVLMVGFSNSESQGIAWAEAWAVDVPTLIWRNETLEYEGRILKCSTAPYLSQENGVFFDNLTHFESMLTDWENHRGKFHPRKWVLENMSDSVCAQKIFDMAAQ